jgi:hypothetical protein
MKIIERSIELIMQNGEAEEQRKSTAIQFITHRKQWMKEKSKSYTVEAIMLKLDQELEFD